MKFKYLLVFTLTIFTYQASSGFEIIRDTNKLIHELKQFNKVYKKRPIKDNNGGMHSVSMFWIWYIVKQIKPNIIVESGVWKGQSTWLLEQAAPNARIICIDPLLEKRIYISENATYCCEDFSKIKFEDISDLVSLCFFDDHQNAVTRVSQAYKKGFKHLLFDDNYQPNLKGGHLSIATAIDNGEYSKIETLISKYKELPQIFGTTIFNRFHGKTFTIKSINLKSSDTELSIYKKEAWTYSQIAYLNLY